MVFDFFYNNYKLQFTYIRSLIVTVIMKNSIAI